MAADADEAGQRADAVEPGEPIEPAGAVEPVRVGLIGYGLAGAAFHAPVIAAVEGLTLAAIVTGDPDRAGAARAHYPAARVVGTVEALWGMADGLDVVVVAAPNRAHVPLGLAALEAGLHVVVDKPLAASVADGRRLIEAARGRGRLLTVYQNRRWDGDFRTLRRLIEAGALGEVHRLESRFERWRPTPKGGWRQDPDPAEAGGLLFDLGAHLIDQALVLFGPARDVYAEIDVRRSGARVDDDVFLALTHENGVRSHLWMNAISARPAPRFRALGSRATWTKHGLDPQEAWLREGRPAVGSDFGRDSAERFGMLDDGASQRPTPTEPGCYPTFYDRLHDAVRTGAPVPVVPEDALAVLEVIERARAAAGAA